MNSLMVFENKEFGTVRTVLIDGEPWFIGVDIAKILDYKDTYSALRHNVDKEDKRLCPVSSTSGVQNTTVVNESGLYSMIFGSKLDSAKKFKKWVTGEVLPTIRKTGAYGIRAQDSYLISDPIERAKRWIEEQEEKQRLLEKVDEMSPKAEYFDNLVSSKLLTNFRDTAKELGMSQTQFTGWLLENGYVYKDSRGTILPYENQRKKGLFEIKDFVNPYNGFSGRRSYVTVKGKEVFRLLCGCNE